MSALSHDASAAPIPSGTVAFIFTDIEGSTLRWERDRAAMLDAVRRHDALMRATIGEHRGHVFKTIGDAFCAAFARPEDAVAAMFDAQHALGAEDFSAVDGLRVRAAIHTGTADERDADYFGPAVNRVARLLGIAHGGQVLVSGVTGDLVRGALPARASLRDLGEHRLKDLARPENVYQLLGPGLIETFPPLRSLEALPHNLPLALKSFIGRESEIAEIAALLETSRLVTLVGSGGIGKTRTSLQVAANVLDRYGDGVWFVELAPLTHGDYIPTTIAQILGIALATENDALAQLVGALADKRALVIFDNCEHLIEAAARTIAALLRGCPRIAILASTRQALAIAGEKIYRMPALGVPSAVALFVDRARASDHRFELTDDNAPIVADICRRLDGIALAIELAAARVRILGPKQLRERLDERFRVLTGGHRDVLPRQQTLRALIDWSHDLLDDRERTIFRRLAIFVNGFTLEGASIVASDETLDEFEIFDVLASLVEKSLILAEPSGDSLRYRLLESTRAYASEKLADAGERDRLASRHLRFFRDAFGALRAATNRARRDHEFLAAFEAELEDLRVALDGALARSDVDAGAELLAEIRGAWIALGITAEGWSRLDAFLARIDRSKPLLVAQLNAALARIHNQDGRRTLELETSLEAVSYARLSGDGETLGRALDTYAGVCCSTNRLDEAEAALMEAEAIASPSGRLTSNLLQSRAILSQLKGDFVAAARVCDLLIKESRATGDVRSVHVQLLNLAEVEHARGATPRAIAIVREALPFWRESSERVVFASAFTNLAGYLLATGDPVAAAVAARESIGALAASEPNHARVAFAIEHLALTCALRGELARAATLAGYAEGCLRGFAIEREMTERGTHDRLLPLLRANLAADELTRLGADGAALAPEAAIALALEELPS